MLTLTPFAQWRRDHALHHASSGDLDRRGHGDVPTLTVREYLAQVAARATRLPPHPPSASLLLGGPIHLMVGQRLRGSSKATGAKQVASVWMHERGDRRAAHGRVLRWSGGSRCCSRICLPYYIAAMAGVWLFYVQHQFEDAYWEPHDEWDYATPRCAAARICSFRAVLQWFTGSIGLHHVHHLAPRIPNYRLQSCHDSSPVFEQSPVITVRSAMASLRLALWDEERGRLVRFRDVPVVAANG